jgi:biotin carboxyl carrier protein
MEIKKRGKDEMKKYFINNNGVEKLIQLGDDKAVIDGKEYFYSAGFLHEGFLILRVNDQNFYLNISSDDNHPGHILIESRGELFRVKCRNELGRLIEKMGYNKSDGNYMKKILSPMPGVIVKLNVKEGQQLKQGDVILVLEAMKMENEIKAERECIVRKVNTTEKKSVEKGELLIELE